MPKYESMQERLIANSVVSERFFWNGSPCWEWIGKYVRSNRGLAYGVLNVRFKSGPRKGKVRTVRAHRVALQVFKGRYLGKRYVGGHACNISWCINPEHLVGGTQQANVRKTVREGRHRNGYNKMCDIWPKCSCIGQGTMKQCDSAHASY